MRLLPGETSGAGGSPGARQQSTGPCPSRAFTALRISLPAGVYSGRCPGLRPRRSPLPHSPRRRDALRSPFWAGRAA